MGEFQYQIAFSFLAEDEDIARQLDDKLRDRLTTFLYSRRQGELAGTDGEQRFAEVFGRDARLVVILFRRGWGMTAWTRIEQTAIRNRSHEQGYDFVFLICLADSADLPDWFPRGRIWYDYERFGIDGAAAVIAQRVQDAGGQVRRETPAEHAARTNRRLERAAQRQAFRDSPEGMAAAQQAVTMLFAEIRSWRDRISQESSRVTLNVQEQNGRAVSVVCGEWTVTVHWGSAGSLAHSTLLVQEWRGIAFLGHVRQLHPPVPVSAAEYDYDLDAGGEPAWRLRASGNERFFSSSQLAEHLVFRALTLFDTGPAR